MNRIRLKKTVDGQSSQSDLEAGIARSAFAFRGFNQTNLGRTPELLRHCVYGPYVEKYLRLGSEICSEATGKQTDLVKRVAERIEPGVDHYHEAVSLVVASELAQMEILQDHFGVNGCKADMMFGYSLGELSILAYSGVLTMEDALSVPLKMCEDAVALAQDATLCILFSRSKTPIPRDRVQQICTEINAEGKGIIGISAFLAPNSMLLIGQNDTLKRLRERSKEIMDDRISIRFNDGTWPPMHTPIVWQRNITNRSQCLMQTMASGFTKPSVPVFSLATGGFSYDGTNTREIIGKWIDQPQMLWEAVDTVLLRGVKTIVHVGPEPNIVPSTFERLASNIEHQTGSKRSLRTLSSLVKRGWLKQILPKRTNLLRAPHVKHIVLENWLLEQIPE